MKKLLLAALLSVLSTGTFAQTPEIGSQFPKSGVSSDGNWKQTERVWKVVGDKCLLDFKYEGVSSGDQGRTRSEWTATPYNGGHLCTNGVWRDLSGSGNSGKNSNIYIKSGKAFRVLSM
jgi:hypothetical protein